MPYFEITDLDWNLFEEKYNIPRTETVEVTNIFRHICRLFVLKTDLDLWNTKWANWEKFINVEINYYHIADKKIWSNLKLKK
jgi:hypothetical protein